MFLIQRLKRTAFLTETSSTGTKSLIYNFMEKIKPVVMMKNEFAKGIQPKNLNFGWKFSFDQFFTD